MTLDEIIDYPVAYSVKRLGFFRWVVIGNWKAGVASVGARTYQVTAPFCSKLTALRVESALTQQCYTHYDMGRARRQS